MKKIILLLIILPVGISISLAQNPLMVIEDWYEDEFGILGPESRVSFEYDNQGNESIVDLKNWDANLKEYQISRRTVYTYNESNQVTKIESQTPVDFTDFYTYFQIDFFYSDECLKQKITTNYLIDFNNTIRFVRTEDFNPITCKQDSSKIIYTQNFQGFNQNVLKKYTHNGDTEIIDYYYTDSLNIFLEDPTRRITTTYNNQDQRTSILNISLLTEPDQIGGYSEFEYDQNNNISLETNFDIFLDTMIPTLTFKTEYIYNEDQQILQAEYFRSSSSSIETIQKTIEYDYTCDGLLKKSKQTNYPAFNSYERYYFHLNGYDCKDESETKNLISIRPNFTQDFVLVQSEILRSAKSKIAIYDMSGKCLKLFSVSEGLDNYYLKIGDLIPGNYIIHVFDDQQSAAERVLKI